MLLIGINAMSQQMNGQTFTFPKGKTEWSDTVFRKLRTEKMAKEGIPSVLIAIRYKLVKETGEGKWYEIEVGNKSTVTKIKFNVRSGRDQEVYTVRLDPGEIKVFRKFYWRAGLSGTNPPVSDDDIINSPFEEILQNRE